MFGITLIPQGYGPPQPQHAPSATAAVETRDRLLRSFPQVSIWRDGAPVSEGELAHFAAQESRDGEIINRDVEADGPLLPPTRTPLRVVTRR